MIGSLRAKFGFVFFRFWFYSNFCSWQRSPFFAGERTKSYLKLWVLFLCQNPTESSRIADTSDIPFLQTVLMTKLYLIRQFLYGAVFIFIADAERLPDQRPKIGHSRSLVHPIMEAISLGCCILLIGAPVSLVLVPLESVEVRKTSNDPKRISPSSMKVPLSVSRVKSRRYCQSSQFNNALMWGSVLPSSTSTAPDGCLAVFICYSYSIMQVFVLFEHNGYIHVAFEHVLRE